MRDSEKITFVKLFNKEKAVSLAKIQETLSYNSEKVIEDKLMTWKWKNLYDIKNGFVIRNQNPTV
jgi:hypothetical protein